MSDAPGAAPSLSLWRVERILFDEDDLLIVDKPPGLPVHGGDESLGHSVVDRLSTWRQEQGRDAYLSVHQRLDQETSGLLFFVTDEAKNAVFARAMEQHQIERVYWAVVAPRDGSVDPARLPETKRIELWLSHVRGRTEASDGKPPRGSKNRDQAKRAVTHIKVVRREGERSLLELRLETGRTHQIRATMAHLGFPVVGDRLYGGQRAERLMLHASLLAGGPLPRKFESSFPTELEAALVGHESSFDDLPARLQDAASHRAPLLARTSALRLVNGAGDGLAGMTVDAYGAYAVLNLYAAELLPRAREIAELIAALGFRGVYVKQRVRADLRTRDAEELAPKGPLVGEPAPSPYLVDENGMQIHIDLEDGLSTGLFVDMRDNRMRTRGWARGGQMLNLFCYTSTFSVSAALSGAVTTSVDLSAKAIERSRANFEVNGLDPHQHRFFKEDAMKFLARVVRRGDEYDFIVLDPPSFSTVGKGTFSVKSRYGRAAADCFRILSRRGRLLCVTNHTKTSPRAFRKTVEVAAEAAGRRIVSLKELKPGLDCPPHPDGLWPSKSLLVEIS